MNYIISINNLNYKYGTNVVFEELNLNVEKGSFIHIVGSNGCGKSTLVNILKGKIITDTEISVYNMKLNNKNSDEIKKYISIVSRYKYNSDITVEQALKNQIKDYQVDIDDDQKSLMGLDNYIKIKKILNKKCNQLMQYESILFSLAQALITNPKVIILDDFTNYINEKYRKDILSILNKINKTKKITVLNFTSNTEDVIFGDIFAVLNNHTIEVLDNISNIINYEKYLKSIGLSLPFIVDLSNKLKYYGLVDKIYFNEKGLVKRVWQ